MQNSDLLPSVLYFLLAAVLVIPLGKRLGLGPILCYLAAGVFLGPGGLGLISDPQAVLHFAELGVILMLFVLGLELHPAKLWELRSAIFGLGSSQLLLCWTLLGALAWLVGLSWQAALVIGAALSLSSTAFAVQLMNEHRLLTTPLGRDVFGILLLQDLAVIPILLLTGYLAPAQASQEQVLPWYGVLLAFGLFLLVGRFILPLFLRLVAQSGVREVLTAFALLLVIGSAELMNWLGLSAGLGAFVAGIMLANSSYRHQLETDIEPFKGLLLGLFFMAVGMSMELGLLLSQPLLLLGLLSTLLLSKALVIGLLGKLRHHGWRSSIAMGLILAEGGEFAFVLLTQAKLGGLLDEDIVNALVLAIGLSMALTPLLFTAFRATRRKQQDNRQPDAIEASQSEVIICGFGRVGQISGRLLASSGIPFVALDKDPRHVDVVRQFGGEVYFGDGTRLDMLMAAGIARTRVLLLAVDGVEDSLAIASLVQQHFPHVTLIARARDRNHAYRLLALGVKQVFRETFGSALNAAEQVLQGLGLSEVQAADMARTFAEHDQALVLAGAAHHHDLDALIRISNEGKAELASLLKGDRERNKP
ncbi:monovalent cation:proton antiporter-2 (CPA2) family protein [Shewanella cyperi]|uniref:monovalent cation:proton antiporter-2 (CPA2) family protein n=1 Tax=Shewanella cyperi TaxID=2814292 RepID=UPI001A94B939|nr:monovalent cation:proton antiporter-2 (CPA2) family protein [Shewanella cyperi]QSX39766.1 cation:proton antiporter [Shewanella cyperi]